MGFGGSIDGQIVENPPSCRPQWPPSKAHLSQQARQIDSYLECHFEILLVSNWYCWESYCGQRQVSFRCFSVYRARTTYGVYLTVAILSGYSWNPDTMSNRRIWSGPLLPQRPDSLPHSSLNRRLLPLRRIQMIASASK